MRVILGCDVGGTNVKCGVFTEDGQLLAKGSSRTPALVDAEAYGVVLGVFDRLLEQAGATRADVVGIGLDTPGAILKDGTHALTHNLDIDLAGLRAAIKEAFPDATQAVLNDGNAAAVGELWQGAAKGHESFVLYVLGTGVGSGIVVDGQLVVGANGAGGESGHMTVNPFETRTCGCGRPGCVELYSSATGLVRTYRETCASRGLTPVDTSAGAVAVFDAMKDGDPVARHAVEVMCDMLALCLSNTACVLDPELFVMGGGVSQGWADFGELLCERYRARSLEAMRETPIVPAQLGNDAGIFGAAFEALRAGNGA